MKSNYNKVKPNSQTDSNKINNTQINVADDIVELYKNYISMKNAIEVHNILSPITTNTIVSMSTALENTINNIDSTIFALSFYTADKIKYPSILERQYKCKHDQPFGEVVLPIASSFIEYNYVNPITGNKTIIQDASKYIKSFITNNRFRPRVDDIFENSNINIVDQNSSLTHVVKAITKDNNIDDLSIVYNLETPETIGLNTIKIYPVPELITMYEKVSISGPSATGALVTDYSGTSEEFEDDDGNLIMKGNKRAFRFEETDIDNVSVVLRNSNYTQLGNDNREFVIGSRLISLENNTYMAEGWIGVEIDCSNAAAMTSLTTDYIGENDNIEVYVYKSIYDFNAMEGHDLYGSVFTIKNLDLDVSDTDKIYILYKITKHDNNTTPIIKGCSLTWELL